MKALALIPLLGLAACATDNCPPPGIQVKYQTVTKTVQTPCRVAIPKRPAPVTVAPGTDALALLLTYKAKLEEWGGAGDSYANESEAAIRACQKGGSD